NRERILRHFELQHREAQHRERALAEPVEARLPGRATGREQTKPTHRARREGSPEPQQQRAHQERTHRCKTSQIVARMTPRTTPATSIGKRREVSGCSETARRAASMDGWRTSSETLASGSSLGSTRRSRLPRGKSLPSGGRPPRQGIRTTKG